MYNCGSYKVVLVLLMESGLYFRLCALENEVHLQTVRL